MRHRIRHRIVSRHAHAQPHPGAPRNRDQVVIQLESRLDGEPVHSGNVSQQFEIEIGLACKILGHVPQKFPRNDNRGLSAKYDYLCNGPGLPFAQFTDNRIRI